MPVKIFVGNLDETSKAEPLREKFEQFGEVIECDVLNRFAFVHMTNDEEANAAIEALNGSYMDGHSINVELSDGGGRGGRGRGRGRGDFRGRGGYERGRGDFRGRGRGRYEPYGREERPYRPTYDRDPYDRYPPPPPPPPRDPYRDPYYDPYRYPRDPYDRYALPPPYDRDPYAHLRDRDPYARPPPDAYERDPYARPPPEYYRPEYRPRLAADPRDPYPPVEGAAKAPYPEDPARDPYASRDYPPREAPVRSNDTYASPKGFPAGGRGRGATNGTGKPGGYVRGGGYGARAIKNTAF